MKAMPEGKSTVYVETSVISYYVARPSGNVIIAGHQHITWQWWEEAVEKSRRFISSVVYAEIIEGDPELAQKRLNAVNGWPILMPNIQSEYLLEQYLRHKVLPAKAERDAAHIAIATSYKMNYLATWNCTHIANAYLRDKIDDINRAAGYRTPVICTPEELLK
ncbi:MAG: type II toxin-antitoxin system VapC family toxin [Candidatus Hydrogenedentes bacterium]|nr:type II toxin-antitoxin system VapC family toxin [Candidatus Hydrogenedentota bacterium]